MLWCCCEPQEETILTAYSYQGQSSLILGGTTYQHSATQYAATVAGVRFQGAFGGIQTVTGWFTLFFPTPPVFAPATSTLKLVPWSGTGTRTGAITFGFAKAVYEQRVTPQMQVRLWFTSQDTIIWSPPWDFFTPATSPPNATNYFGPVAATLNGQGTTEIDITSAINDVLAGPLWNTGDFIAVVVAPTTANLTTGPPWNPNEWSAWIAENDGLDTTGVNRSHMVIG